MRVSEDQFRKAIREQISRVLAEQEDDEIRAAVEKAEDLMNGEGIDRELAAEIGAREFDVPFESVWQGLKQDMSRPT